MLTKAEQTRLTSWRLKILQCGTASPRNVARTCRHFGISRRAFYKWKRRFEKLGVALRKATAWHRLQLDVKFLERIPGTRKRFFQFTAIDDCTRIRVLKVYDACTQATAIRFVNDVVRRLPFRVHVIQTDNGAEFQSRFHWHLESLDIRHVYIRPRTPHLNGKVERSHRVDDQEFYQVLDRDGITDDIHLFTGVLRTYQSPM
jgi:transposase InsO family protein